ncbi:MAG: leucine-rich repeat domain-containing protein [Dysgonamonadaceae bacterium]|jgi:hypothetical protein|nr:leucine-rich repeat domain-containing protein [Dysgonamonadaceae bacterium]
MRTRVLFLSMMLLAGTATGWSQTSGTCGENLTWTLENNTLTISGTGAMLNYSDYNYYSPWYSSHSSIITVIIENGVTGIGNYAFYRCTGLTSITIPEGVTALGMAFFRVAAV